jgi:hypothetical protein
VIEPETYGTEQLLADLRAYTCPVHGCESSLRSNSLMCRGHWALVPADQKREVYEQIRRLERIGKRYERAEPGSKRQGDLATEDLREEDLLREIQLRAVIVASERAGARPEPVGSAPKTIPRKGGCMKIKVCRVEDGPARVDVLTAEGETVTCVEVNAGQEVEIAIANTPDTPPTVGEVCETAASGEGEAAGAGEGEGESATAGGEGEGGEPASGAEGEGGASGGEGAPA